MDFGGGAVGGLVDGSISGDDLWKDLEMGGRGIFDTFVGDGAGATAGEEQPPPVPSPVESNSNASTSASSSSPPDLSTYKSSLRTFTSTTLASLLLPKNLPTKLPPAPAPAPPPSQPQPQPQPQLTLQPLLDLLPNSCSTRPAAQTLTILERRALQKLKAGEKEGETVLVEPAGGGGGGTNGGSGGGSGWFTL